MAHFDIVQLPGVQESDYDFEFEAAYFSGTYFGNIYGQNGEHCFDAYLMDKPMDGDYFAAGTTAYLFDIFTTAPGDSKNPRPAPGVYTLGELYATVSMTFTPDLSGRAESPSLGIIDSRSVRTSHHIDGQRGIDGNKKIKGRKEHIVVDTLGLLMSVRVHPANVHDSVGAEEVFESMRYKFPGLKRILADGGYRGETVRNTVMRLLHCDLDVVLRSDKRTDRFVPMPKRWIVERTFSWLENFRRLTIDYEYRADTHEAMMHIAAIKLFLNKI